jgi:predicted nucleic acid-binding protein
MAAVKRVVDTSAWIEWLTASPLGKKLGKELPDKPHCIVPTIVQLELSKWLVRELGEEQADQVIAYTQKCLVVPLDTTIALLAADLHRQHKLATADAIVYATAQKHGADLLTCDAHFKGLAGAVVVSKAEHSTQSRNNPISAS